MSRSAVLWVALGTPTEPTTKAVRTYLREFLRDRRVVEMNPVAWRIILELFILPRRPKVSAGKYRSIWSPGGSPLLVNTRAQVDALKEELTSRGIDTDVVYATRYGQPSIATVLNELRSRGVDKVLVMPTYPQYSQSTVASTFDAVARYILGSRDQMEMRFVRSWPTQPGYIEALAQRCEQAWAIHGRPDFDHGDMLLLSFHGTPVSMYEAGDPYKAECEATAAALRTRLGVTEEQAPMTFQSRFGPAPWLTPATIDTVTNLGQSGLTRVDVVCPGFVADCLETLEEIGLLNRDAYERSLGGTGTFVPIPCVNDHPAFISGLADIAQSHLQGWV